MPDSVCETRIPALSFPLLEAPPSHCERENRPAEFDLSIDAVEVKEADGYSAEDVEDVRANCPAACGLCGAAKPSAVTKSARAGSSNARLEVQKSC